MSISQDIIRTVDLRFDYGLNTAVQNLNLAIPSGEIYGLIGPNGAGKTTLIRLLSTLLEPTYGEIHVKQFDASEQPDEVRKSLGYMPDNVPVCEELKVWEYLDLFAASHFIKEPERTARVDECIHKVNLETKRESFTSELSRGMKQRLFLAKTLLHEPEVLLLDEPASGLDPIARVELRETLKELRQSGKTILISSHILTDLADFCTFIGIMEKGSLIESGRLEEVMRRIAPGKHFLLETLGADPDPLPILKSFPHVRDVVSKENRYVVTFDGNDGNDENAAELLALLVSGKVRVKSFYEEKTNIEEVFLKIGAREVS